jgi:hypothetical protein
VNSRQKKPRRWLQYSLRSFAIALTLFGVFLGLRVEKARRQKAAVTVWRGLGAQIVCRHEMIFGPAGFLGVNSLAEPPGPDWARRLLGAEYFDTVDSVQLATFRQVTDADFAALAGLPDLKTLEVYARFRISDEGIGQLRALTRIERLVLANTEGKSDPACVSDASLQTLAKLRSLRELFLLDAVFSAESADHLRRQIPDCKIVQ